MSSPDNELNIHLSAEESSDAREEYATEKAADMIRDEAKVAEWLSTVLAEEGSARDDFISYISKAIASTSWNEGALVDAIIGMEDHIEDLMKDEARAEFDMRMSGPQPADDLEI